MRYNHETGEVTLDASDEYWVVRNALANVGRLNNVSPEVGERFDSTTLELAHQHVENMPVTATLPYEIPATVANVAAYAIKRTRSTSDDPKARKARRAIASELERYAATPVVGVE